MTYRTQNYVSAFGFSGSKGSLFFFFAVMLLFTFLLQSCGTREGESQAA